MELEGGFETFRVWGYIRLMEVTSALFHFVCLAHAVRLVGASVPLPGIKPMPSALDPQGFNHWTTKEFPSALVYPDH